MDRNVESITLEAGAAPGSATIRSTGITVAEIVKVFKAGGDPLKEFSELVPMDLVTAGAYYGANADAFRDVV